MKIPLHPFFSLRPPPITSFHFFHQARSYLFHSLYIITIIALEGGCEQRIEETSPSKNIENKNLVVGKQTMLFKKMSHEVDMDVEASRAWELFSSMKLPSLVKKELPQLFQKTELVQGDGGVGSRIKLTFTPEFCYTEEFTKIDHENWVKEAEGVEGGYMELGFTMYRVRFEVIEKDPKSCVVRATIEYELKEEAATNASMVTLEPLILILETAKKHLSLKG